MLNLSDKELDHFAKEAAQEYDPGDVLGERSWEGLEIRLDRDLGKVRLNPLGHIRRLPFYYAPAMLVLLGVSYYLMRRPGGPPGRVVKAPAAVVQNSSISQSPDYTKKSTLDSSASTTTLPAEQAGRSPAGGGEGVAAGSRDAGGIAGTSGAGASAAGASAAGASGAGNKAAANASAAGNNGASGANAGAGGSVVRNDRATGTREGAGIREGAGMRASGGKTAGENGAAGVNSPAGEREATGRNAKAATVGSAATGTSAAGRNAAKAGRATNGKNADMAGNTSADGNTSAGGITSGTTRGAGNAGGATSGLAAPQRELGKVAVQGLRPMKKGPYISDSALRAFTLKSAAPQLIRKGGAHINRSLELGVLAAPDFASVNSLAGDRPGSTIGLTVDYQFANHWHVGSGLLLDRKIFSAYEQDFHAPPNFYADNGVRGDVYLIKGAFEMLEVPINLRYDFTVSGSTMFFISSGLSSYLLTSQNNNYYYHAIYNPRSNDCMPLSSPDKSYLFSALNLSVGVETGLSNSLSLLIAPYIKVPVRGVGIGQVQLNTVGINFALRFAPVISRKRY